MQIPWSRALDAIADVDSFCHSCQASPVLRAAIAKEVTSRLNDFNSQLNFRMTRFSEFQRFSGF